MKLRIHNIEKLLYSNYNLCSIKMKVLLIWDWLFFVVDGKELNHGIEDPPIQAIWKLKDSKVKAGRMLYCCDWQVQLVQALKASKEVWDKLLAIYQQIDITT